MAFEIVIPTIGRPSLRALLESLARARGPLPERVFVVDDRGPGGPPFAFEGLDVRIAERIRVLHSGGRGPAAARNVGWRAGNAPYVAFLDDDVLVGAAWLDGLCDDIAALRDDEAATQARLDVPLPPHRPPTDWERNVKSLENAHWITADLCVRRLLLERTGGFDERFRRAYREDADFALRVFASGYRIARGRRRAMHPVRPADRWVSLRLQAGNADDVLMAALHGRRWRIAAAAPAGRFPAHAVTAALGTASLLAFALRRRRQGALLFAAWLTATGEFAWRRIAPGPRDPGEVSAMMLTSVAIPFAAVYHRLRGVALARRMRRAA